jgi:hypothetical protein
MKTRSIVAISVLVIAASSLLGAQAGGVRYVDPQTRMLRLVEPWVPPGHSGDTTIMGTVIDIRQAPVGYAPVQLRDLNTGVIKGEAVSGPDGEYQFKVLEPGTYVVEMALNGQVLALSNAGSIARYQTMNTVIQLPGRWDASRNLMTPLQQRVMSFFGMSSQKSMTAATLQAATDANVAPADPGEPVSP